VLAWWHISAILEFRRLRLVDLEFKDYLAYAVRLSLRK
jgi:hypothetical protein